MPISYTIDDARSLIHTTASGVLTDDDIIAHKASLASDRRIRPTMRELSDIRGVDRLDVTPEGITRMIWADQETWPAAEGKKLAIVVSTEVAYGLGRMYQIQASPVDEKVRIFRDLDEAKSWLGLRS